MISYELVLSSAILLVIMLTGNLNLTVNTESQRAIWYLLPLLPIFIIFFIGSVAETNRAPFDLAEAKISYLVRLVNLSCSFSIIPLFNYLFLMIYIKNSILDTNSDDSSISASVPSQETIKERPFLHPWWVVGFTDGGGAL